MCLQLAVADRVEVRCDEATHKIKRALHLNFVRRPRNDDVVPQVDADKYLAAGVVISDGVGAEVNVDERAAARSDRFQKGGGCLTGGRSRSGRRKCTCRCRGGSR